MKKRPLMLHQSQAIAFVNHRLQVRRLNGNGAGVFMAPGTGKTLAAIRAVVRSGEYPVLIVCRRDDFKTWRDELHAEGVPSENVFAIEDGTTVCEWPCLDMGSPYWILCTYDLVKSPATFSWLTRSHFAWCIADESHMIKRWKSARTKKVIKATRHIMRRLAMTGSPITNDPLDVFSQCLYIDNGATFGPSEWLFLKRYYLRSGKGWYIRKEAKQTIGEKLKSIAIHVHEDDVLKLPPWRNVVKAVPLSGMQRRHYESILTNWETQLRGETLEVDQVVVQIEKLRQISSGFLYPAPDAEPVWLRSPKMDLLFDLLTDPDYLGRKKKVVVWCSRTAEIERIAQEANKQKIGNVIYYGGMNARGREAARTMYKEMPHIKLFIAQVDAGVGMNELIVAGDAVYFSNSTRVVSRMQSERRIRRKGTERMGHRVITYWDLVSEGTVDESIRAAVMRSVSVASVILARLKKGVALRDALLP